MVAVPPTAGTLAMPVFYQPLIDQQVIANVSWGTPAEKVIPTVVDTGSYGYWVAGPDAIVNSGSPYLGQMGSCNQTVEPFFNWPESSSHSGPHDEGKAIYLYGGGGKRINCPTAVNDTMNFGGGYPPIENVQVASCDFIQIKSSSTTCNGAHYDKSIMGLAPIPPVQGGPQIHPELLKQGRLSSDVFSIWFDAPPADINEPQMGTLHFGPIPEGKYSGDLATLRNDGVDRAEKGYYYIGMPEVSAANIDGKGDKTVIPAVDPANVPGCLVDSGTWGMTLPTDDKAFYAATGLEADSPFIIPRYPSDCADIPADAGFEMAFTGKDGKVATVKIPFRSLAQGPGEAPGTCRLNLQLGDINCTLGGTFYAAAFVSHDDEAGTVSIAQGALAGSAQGPPAKLRL